MPGRRQQQIARGADKAVIGEFTTAQQLHQPTRLQAGTGILRDAARINQHITAARA
ncbi:hypothetical protein D3C84_1169530 [compost metagenome]